MAAKKSNDHKSVKANSTAPPAIKGIRASQPTNWTAPPAIKGLQNTSAVRAKSTAPPGSEKKTSKATMKKEIKTWNPKPIW